MRSWSEQSLQDLCYILWELRVRVDDASRPVACTLQPPCMQLCAYSIELGLALRLFTSMQRCSGAQPPSCCDSVHFACSGSCRHAASW